MCTREKNLSSVKIICLSMIISNSCFVIRAERSDNIITEARQCTMNDGTLGTCILVEYCDWWMKKMRNHQFPLDSERCGFFGLGIIACCPQQQPTDRPVVLTTDEGALCTMETDQEPGVCKAIHKCQFRIDQVRQGKRFYTEEGRCSFDGYTEIVCCPTNERLQPNVPKLNVRPAEGACLKYESIVTGEDRLNVNPLIIGGEEAESGEFPFMVALGYRNNPEDRSLISYICGGSLITLRHVLTAAHCILNINNYRPVQVRVGSISLIDNSQDVQTISISNIKTHPSYRMSRNYFDIAIITMSQSVTISNKTIPICLQTSPLPTLQNYLNSEMIATGWGVTNFNDATPSQNLKKTRKLSLIDRQTCGAQYKASNRIPYGVDDSLLCILDENPVNRSDTCQGDSGGPLFLRSKINSLIGIVSFGQSCASSVPGIYTSVYWYLDWIEGIVWPNGQASIG